MLQLMQVKTSQSSTLASLTRLGTSCIVTEKRGLLFKIHCSMLYNFINQSASEENKTPVETLTLFEKSYFNEANHFFCNELFAQEQDDYSAATLRTCV